MATKDKELDAISSIIDQLSPLDAATRSRVLEYVLKRLEMTTVAASRAVTGIAVADSDRVAPNNMSRIAASDIRSFTAERQPRSANEMVAVLAYYLAELAPESERRETINTEITKRYFKMAAFPLPRMLKNTLPNATAAGYLENVSRGEYRLNPVGYNLVVHRLPQGGASPVAANRRKPRKKGARK